MDQKKQIFKLNRLEIYNPGGRQVNFKHKTLKKEIYNEARIIALKVFVYNGLSLN